ncbi:unnamed protein product [Leptosia nina]|uniref:Uncharacterized protein n=1 Tax=Leptosia nina TaxID=320188 RepID=A0AAV1JIY5_9NEOP
MTSEIDVSKTNELLRRRKLRLQQVREQSKDIAKKVRQRAKVEKLRHVISLDAQKEKQYFALQEKLVDRLEHLYAQSLQNLGSSHKNAANVINADDHKKDLSKLRGREAIAEVRKRKQEKLDEQKKLLDRKLQARETANELSKEKSLVVSKTLNNKLTDVEENKDKGSTITVNNKDISENSQANSHKNDMGTQWHGEELSQDSSTIVPKLLLPEDDNNKLKENEKGDSKRINLFALSDEMPSSLRGGNTMLSNNVPQQKSSLTLVSEYLQTRNLRLRETEPIATKKSDDLQSLKETILEVEVQRQTPVTNVFINKRSPCHRSDLSSQTLLKRPIYRKTKPCTTPVKYDKSKVSSDNLAKKNSVTTYNHSTRDTKDVSYNNDQFVVREQTTSDDAYTKALLETSIVNEEKKKVLEKKKEENRNRIAVTREKVDKEYKDTLSFLNSLSKEKSTKPYNTLHMDEVRQQIRSEKQQRKLEEEFKRIEKDSTRRLCKHTEKSSHQGRKKSCSPEHGRNTQYDWTPVPENDVELPTQMLHDNRNQKNNSVKFNDVDTYHEYRSRHRHTPPTKDVPKGKGGRMEVVETLVMEQNSSTTDASSVTSDESCNSFKMSTKTDKAFLNDPRLSDGDRIVIYKILDSKKSKKSRNCKNTRIMNQNKAMGTSENGDKSIQKNVEDNNDNSELPKSQAQQDIAFEKLNEGIYKVADNGDNVASMYFSETVQHDDTECKKSGSPTDTNQQPKTSSCRCQHRCFGCRCSRRNPKPAASAATSTSSFQTATNDKSGNIIVDGGFIKMDEAGKDAGKFYVGASGFLKDDNYEVVIQLKKKELEKADTLESATLPARNQSKMDTEVQQFQGQNLRECAAQTSINQEHDDKIELSSKAESVIVPDEKTSASTITSNKNANVESNTKNVVDKQVNTTFLDNFNNPDQMPKSDNPRPATSTYTQTSFNSPVSRPVFMHMSSSTSTAYMSPPELILPRFLRQNQVLCTDDDLLSNNDNYREKFQSNKRYGCTRKPSHSEESYKCKIICSTTDTPPNTARSHRDRGYMSENLDNNHRHKPKSKVCRKSHKHRSSTKAVPGTESVPALLSRKSYHKTPRIPNVFTKKKGLNPVVQEYVNKLLALNKEGLKAIQVINQDCSSVDTPRSSIVNASCNMTKKGAALENKISLEQLKVMLEQQILNDYAKRAILNNYHLQSLDNKDRHASKIYRRRKVHKVKSLNISKNLFKNKNSNTNKPPVHMNIHTEIKPQSSTSSTSIPLKEEEMKGTPKTILTKRKSRSKSSPTPRRNICRDKTNMETNSVKTKLDRQPLSQCSSNDTQGSFDSYKMQPTNQKASVFAGPKVGNKKTRSHSRTPPLDTSTQTSAIDSEINFMKLAENKLQNMEKIANLTEKCTKRLSNLAKVLEEVRRNKTSAYSHISTSDSTSDSEPKNVKVFDDIQEVQSVKSPEEKQYSNKDFDFPYPERMRENSTYIPLLKDLPRPSTSSSLTLSTISEKSDVVTSSSKIDQIKYKTKPPPALSRISLRNVQDNPVVPHELSTVMEIDSPMSVKLSNQPSRRDVYQANETRKESDIGRMSNINEPRERENELKFQVNNGNLYKANRPAPTDTKIEMMDMKLFNDIMLKPFVSLQDYAKQCDVHIDDASNAEDVLKDEVICDEISSLHSDGSLPDVISELLKRKIISEPFKFDSASHVTSSISSESSLSLLALTKMCSVKKTHSRHASNKENVAETSETLSISSNPDLENAFQKLGMGWASSTLKKTKERLALSSSSNTSSSSYRQIKLKGFNKEMPTFTTDSEQPNIKQNIDDSAKNVIQQTSLTNSMTVKEFLTNELAKKITFTNKSNREADEFVSLYETKMPEEIKHTPEKVQENDQSSITTQGNRARTSTPVQIFKSTTYHTTSSSNTSNGLFSNADELSSVKVTSNSIRNHSTSDKDDLTIPNYSLRRKGLSDTSKSD